MTNYTNYKEVKIDVDIHESQSKSTMGGFVIRGSDRSYYKVPKSEVHDPLEFAKGFLHGALFARGLLLEDVVFFPADSIEYIHKSGKAVYCFEYEDHYEFETHFAKKG